MQHLIYKCHSLAINEIPNFYGRDDQIFRGTSTIDNKELIIGNSPSIDCLVYWFKSKIDNLYKDMTYEKVIQAWGGKHKRVEYKGRWLSLRVRKRAKDSRVVYLGEFCSKDYRGYKSIESFHYDKVITKFERFVDEYCTDWEARASYLYKGYDLRINQERGKEFYMGIVQIHKNSIYKHIADTREEVERCCKNRIGKVVYEKEKITKTFMTKTKEEKIKYIETQIAQLSSELEKIKNEKEVVICREVVVVEISNGEDYGNGYLVGRIKDAPDNVMCFYGKTIPEIKDQFNEYLDELEFIASTYDQIINRK